jgi:hypothetical protein
MTDASSSTASSQQQRVPRVADFEPFVLRELAPAFDGYESSVKSPHALGAGLLTPTNSPTVRSPAVFSGLGLNEHPISKHAPKDADLRAGTRAGLGARGKGGPAPEPPQWSADALARQLKIPVKRLKDWVRCGWVQAIQRPFGGVWILHADERELKQLERRVALCQKGRHYPAELAIMSSSKASDADKLV